MIRDNEKIIFTEYEKVVMSKFLDLAEDLIKNISGEEVIKDDESNFYDKSDIIRAFYIIDTFYHCDDTNLRIIPDGTPDAYENEP